MAIYAIPPPYLYLKQCISSRIVYQRNILGVWFHVIINLQTLILYKGNVFYSNGGIEHFSLNRVPWGRWWGGQMMDIWWRRVKIFVKEAFRCTLLPEYREHLGTMEGLLGNGYGR